ncbi:BRCT domain-containing protein [Macrophomina phaseolina MS6]|uniref:BRCT domain-containing protein n=1 Tax=Macrophomina phaseolina (strain MS6) TaxID=1126212 RepID=K2RZH8_MACPH|nr:BRCT domain-containing protein [Macrophomina phaseolina MS6]
MPQPKATEEEISPPSYPDKDDMWHFGDDCSQGVVRRITTQKKAAEYGELHLMKVYDTDMVVTMDNLPPENVILSSNLAYQVIRLVLQTGIIPLRHLHELWPGNFTTLGGPLITMEPLGKPALLQRSSDNANVTFGAYNGYVYLGKAGFHYLVGSDDDNAIQMAKKARPWYDANHKSAGLHTCREFNIISLVDIPRKIDPERIDPTVSYRPVHQKIIEKYKKGMYTFGPLQKSPTHPHGQTYWLKVYKNVARLKASGDLTSWENPSTLTEPLSAIDIPLPDKVIPQKLKDVLDVKSLRKNNVCRGKNIAIAGKPAYTTNQQEWKDFLTAAGATIDTAISATTHFLITCEGSESTSKTLTKQAKKHGTVIITEKAFVEKLQRTSKNVPAEPESSRKERDSPAESQSKNHEDPVNTPTQEGTPTQVSARQTRSQKNPTQEETPTSTWFPEFAHRITFQQIAQSTKIFERLKQNTFETTKTQIENQESVLASIGMHATRIQNQLTRNHIQHDIQRLIDSINAQKDILSNGFQSLSSDHAVGMGNFAAAISKATRKTFEEEKIHEALRHFSEYKDIPPVKELRAPEAWFTFPENQKYGMQRDLEDHNTVRQRYHTDGKTLRMEPKIPSEKRPAPLEFHSPWATPSKKAKSEEAILISDDDSEHNSQSSLGSSLSV